MKDSLKLKLEALNKQYGRPIHKRPKLKPKVSTGILTLDWEMCGGYEKNSIITLYGKEGSLKTTIGLKMLAEAQRRGEDCMLIDIEKGCTMEYMEALGVDVKKLIIVDDLPHGEAYLDLVYTIMNDIDFVMIDSTTALIPKAELDKSLEESGQRAGQAKLFSDALKKFTFVNQNTTILLISQLRESPKSTPSGAISTYLPGGRAIHFYSNYKFNLKRKDRMDEDGNKVDAKISATGRKTDVSKVNLTIVNEKSRGGPSFRVGEIQFDHSTGMTNELEELIKIGVHLNVISIGGSWYSIEFKGEELKAQGSEKFALLIEANTDLEAYIRSNVKETMKAESKKHHATKSKT